MKIGNSTLFVAFVFLNVFVFLLPRPWAASAPDRQGLLNKLIEGARKEGELVVWGVDSLGDDGSKAYGEAFKARFGLKNLRFKYDTAGETGAKFSRAIMETQMGLPASYDAMYAPDHRVITLTEKGGIEPVEHWELLLPEGVDPKHTSLPVVAGLAFAFANRTKANLFNSKLISEDAMPRTTRDVGLPKYKGKFYTSPWTTAPIFGILVYPKEEWLEIMRSWGQNKAATVRPAGGIQRMMLGEFVFEPFSNGYIYFLHKQKGDPIGLDVFDDVTPLSILFNVVRKNARHPNAAKLYTLWATGPEAVQIFEKYAGNGNVHIRESKIGSTEMELIKKKKARLVSWFDSAENLKVLNWYTTKEGQDYEDKIAVVLGLK